MKIRLLLSREKGEMSGERLRLYALLRDYDGAVQSRMRSSPGELKGAQARMRREISLLSADADERLGMDAIERDRIEKMVQEFLSLSGR